MAKFIKSLFSKFSQDPGLSLFVSRDFILRSGKQKEDDDQQPGSGPVRSFSHLMNMMTAVGSVVISVAGLDPTTATSKLLRYHDKPLKVFFATACAFRTMFSVHGGHDVGDGIDTTVPRTSTLPEEKVVAYRKMFDTFRPGPTVLARAVGYSTVSVTPSFF